MFRIKGFSILNWNSTDLALRSSVGGGSEHSIQAQPNIRLISFKWRFLIPQPLMIRNSWCRRRACLFPVGCGVREWSSHSRRRDTSPGSRSITIHKPSFNQSRAKLETQLYFSQYLTRLELSDVTNKSASHVHWIIPLITRKSHLSRSDCSLLLRWYFPNT